MKHKRAVIKVKLKRILHEDVNYEKLNKAIIDSNKVISLAYLFIKSYILYVIENNNNIKKSKIDEPKINETLIGLVFRVLTDTEKLTKGRPVKKNKNNLLLELKKYFEIFKKKTNTNSIETANISYILKNTKEQIKISIINNIKYHFNKHVWKYVKSSFNGEYNKIIENKDSDKLKTFHTELGKVKDDIFNNTLLSDNKYHKWLSENRDIIPVTYTIDKFYSDVEKNTYDYIKCMYKMNKYIQTKELKSYQILPLRTSCYERYVKINTSAMIDIFGNDNYFGIDKTSLLKESGNVNNQQLVWNKCFKLGEFKKNGYSFNNEIDTDWYSVSLNFINNNEISKKENKKQNFRKARDETNKNKKNMSEDEYENYLKEKELGKIKEKEKKKEEDKKRKEEEKQKFNKMTDEEKDKFKIEKNLLSEFPYIEKLLKIDLFNNQLKDDYENGKIVFCDPGKRSPLYLMACNNYIHLDDKILTKNNFGVSIDNNHKFMNYTVGTRSHYLQRFKYSQLIESWKTKLPKNNKRIKNTQRFRN